MPDLAAREREVRRLLAEVYKPEGVDIWLRGYNRSLGDNRPIDLLGSEEGFRSVLFAIERLQMGAM